MRRRNLLALWALAAVGARADETAVRVDRRDRRIVIDVEATVAAPASVVWAVLTDFEHMPRFMSAVVESSIARRDGDHLELVQTVETRVGPLRFAAHSTRAVDLKPMREIHATLIDGDFELYEATTRLAEHGGQTTITSHSESVPKAWLAGFVGTSTVEAEVRRQYTQILAEISRRARS